MNILLADDEVLFAQGIIPFLNELGHEVVYASNGPDALERFEAGMFHVILTDVKMPGIDGIDLLNSVKHERGDAVDVILLTGHADEKMVIRALRAGAFDYLKKPINFDELTIALERVEEHLSLKAENEVLTTQFDKALEVRTAPLREQVRYMQQTLQAELGLDRLHLFSSHIRQVFEDVSRFQGKRDVPFLIEGESGTGKELVARYLHSGDSSSPGAFIALNCSAMPAELFQNELFGYEGGAFTGSRVDGSPGKIEIADGGTLFFDEIGEIPLEFQVQLLRVIEAREYYRVGGLGKLKVDVRFIFATNRLLIDEVAKGRFRQDLYHRINVGHVVVPPLRDRREEILPLAQAFMDEFNIKYNKNFQRLSLDAQQNLEVRHWRGNIRELRNTIERAVILYDGRELTSVMIGEVHMATDSRPTRSSPELPPDGLDLQQHELDIVRRALEKFDGNRTKTARYLGLSLKALQSRIRKL